MILNKRERQCFVRKDVRHSGGALSFFLSIFANEKLFSFFFCGDKV